MFKVLTIAGGLEMEMHGFVDGSNFSDIFDVDWFIQSVARDVKVIKELPPASKRFLLKQLYSLRVPRKVTPHYYLTRILPILKRRHVRFFSLFKLLIYNSIFKLDVVLKLLYFNEAFEMAFTCIITSNNQEVQ